MEAERQRRVDVRAFPSTRRLVTAAMRAGRRIAPMQGLVDVDVTEANRLLSGHEPPATLTAFIVASVARAAAAHPNVHAYRNWRGQLVTHRHVDVTTMVEIATPQGPFGLPHVLRDADIREVPDLAAELHRVKRDPPTSRTGTALERFAPVAARVPGAVRAMYAVMARSVAARQRIGTVAVTAVGGMSKRPRVVDGRVEIRDVLDLTIAIDHNVVDGAPATRFCAGLRDIIETAAVLTAPAAG